MATSANALYVVRLVLGGAAQRRFSTAALVQPREVVRAHTAASSSYAPATPAPEFLETESDEYAGAAEFLPDRAEREASPIPWPTLFSHGDTAKPHRAKPCDIVARLVAENKLGPARKVFDELRALHTPVQQRKVYLSAALASLQPTPEGRADFLFWLELYPNRPAVNNNPGLRDTWEPIVYRLLGEHADDGAFLTDFLFLAGRKGLLPAVFPVFISPLTAILPPEESERAVERALNAYYASTTSQHSRSRRAEFLRGISDTQVERWWNMYLRSLAIVGWDDSARALLYSPPHGVSFSRFTRSVVLGHGLGRKERAAAAREVQAERERNDPLASVTGSEDTTNTYLARRVRRALDPTQLPSVGELADLQRQILKLERVGLLDRFQQRFCAPPSMPAGRKVPSVAAHWWWHAEVLRLSADGEHEAAVRAFRAHFLWVGLPPTSVAPADETTYDAARRVPSTQVLTSVIPSILALLSRGERQAYLHSYMALARHLPSTLRPSEYTYLAFVRAISLADGPGAATGALNAIAAAGADPGEAAWNALLLSLIGRGQVDAALAVLEGMERRAPLGPGAGAITMPPPSARTYAGLVRLCVRHARRDQAALVLARFRAWLATQPTSPGSTSPDAAVFAGAQAEITAADRGHPRVTPQEAELRARRKKRRAEASTDSDNDPLSPHAATSQDACSDATARAHAAAPLPDKDEKEHAFA